MKKLRLFLFIILLISSTGNLFSQVNLEEIKSKLPKLLGASNTGTEFVFGFHPGWERADSDNLIRIYISSAVETEVRLTIPGLNPKPFLIKKTIPNSVIEFTILNEYAQPYRRNNMGMISNLRPTQIFIGRGIIIESDDPIIVYGLLRNKSTTDGFIALPVNALGKEYIISSYMETTDFSSQSLTPFADIIGVYDSTFVRYYIGGNNNSKIRTIDEKIWKPYEVISAILNRGDFWLIASEGKYSDLGGGKVIADKPVSVLSGNYCAYVPFDRGSCDYLIEQELPINYWGNKYYVTPIRDRVNSSLIRVFCKDSLTDFYRDGILVGNLPKNWGTLDDGWKELRASPDGNFGATYSSNNPIYIVQYNPGLMDDRVPTDPFQMTVMPKKFFQNELIFNTPGIKGGMGFTYNYINIVYFSYKNQIPNDLEIGEVYPNGETYWNKIVEIDTDLGSNLNDPDLIGSDYAAFSKSIKLPHDGVYRLRCPSQKIMAYAYGNGEYESYGFPVGGLFVEQNRDDIIPPEPTIVNVQTQEKNNIEKTIKNGYVEDIDNQGNGNLALIVHNKAYSYNTKLEFEKFIPGETKRVDFTVSMIDSTKDGLSIITFADRAGNDTTISVQFNGSASSKIIFFTSPSSNDILSQGNSFKIEWHSNFYENIKLELYQSDKLIDLISPSEKNDGSKDYFVPYNLPNGFEYKIKATSIINPNVFGFSQEFEVLEKEMQNSIILLKPIFEPSIRKGSYLPIMWKTNRKIPVNIDLYASNNFHSNIIKNVSDTNYNWLIPLELDIFTEYKLRISDVVDTNLFVETPVIDLLSEQPNKILTFDSPKINSKYKIGGALQIKWKCNFTGNLKIEIYNSNILKSIIENNYSNKGEYLWGVPFEYEQSKQYSIKITETNKPNISFMSEYFEIYNPLSVGEEAENHNLLRMTPNPANTELEIELLRSEKIQSISVYSMTGRNELSVSNLNESKTKIDILNLSVGKYILEIQTSKGKLTESFVIVR